MLMGLAMAMLLPRAVNLFGRLLVSGSSFCLSLVVVVVVVERQVAEEP